MKRLFITFILIAGSIFTGCEQEKDDSPDNGNNTGGNGAGNTELVAPTANFSFSGNNQYPPCEVSFTNKSQNAYSYEWDFGDGGTSRQTSPKHTYSNGGIYTVTLKAVGEGGENLITKTVNIKQKPTKMKITKVVLLNYPLTNGGSNWDYTSQPDIMFKITCNGSLLCKSGVATDVVYSDLPITYTNGLPITIEGSFDKKCQIDFYDYDDGVLSDDYEWMGGYYFTPSAQNFNSSVLHFYSSTSDLKFDMYVQWLP